jgi:2-keto-3-deoxy-6-phosphogluconate aldolase
VAIEEITAYLQLGVKAIGLTSSLFPTDALASKNMETIRQIAVRAAQAAAAAPLGQQPTL